MNFIKATMPQLWTIILDEDCPTYYKYQAYFELRRRKEKESSRQVSKMKQKAAYTDKTYRVTI